MIQCEKCGIYFLEDDIEECPVCGEKLCPSCYEEHLHSCSEDEEYYDDEDYSEKIEIPNECPVCGKTISLPPYGWEAVSETESVYECKCEKYMIRLKDDGGNMKVEEKYKR